MYPVKRERSLPLQFTVLVAATGVAMFSMLVAPASAQTRPAEIKAKERQDPAAGDVVIINRRTRKRIAPNPYAPAKKATAKEKPKSKKPAKTASPKPVIRRQNEIARSGPALTPPLPKRNTARLRQLPRTEPDTPNRLREEIPAPRRAERPRSNRRTYARQRRWPQRYSRQRPWRQCRILARRCQAGFEGSCYVWQRRCT